MDRTTGSAALESFVQTMTERMASLARGLGSWVLSEEHTLQAQEEHLVRHLHDLGTALLSGMLVLASPSPRATVPCPCGAQASFRRMRAASVTTLLGRLTYTRATYGCASCHQGQAPLDQHLQVAAGSLSLGLQELLALLGATQDSFADAAAVLERLTLVQLCPNTVRAATEDLGAVLVHHTQETATAAQEKGDLPREQTPLPPRLYISMDGVLVHCRTSGWRELKTSCVYTTRTLRARRSPHDWLLRMQQPSYGATLAEAAPFGWQVWVEALRRGVGVADEVIVLGDGAHWIWTLADLFFPGATQIVDWYHASQYLWQAATAIYGEGQPTRAIWAKQQLDALWDGRIEAVLAALHAHADVGGAVDDAISYYTTHRARMDYPAYRARGLQIGSGTIESTCKHLVSARLKQAGMIWSEVGASAVVTVRAWLKSGRWEEAMGLRPTPRRNYQRQQPQTLGVDTGAVPEGEASGTAAALRAGGLPPEMLARVRAEVAHEQATHPWRRGFSIRQQRRQATTPGTDVQPASTA